MRTLTIIRFWGQINRVGTIVTCMVFLWTDKTDFIWSALSFGAGWWGATWALHQPVEEDP